MSAPRSRFAGLLVPSLVVLVAFAILVALGTWQVERKGWKETLIADLTQRLNAPPEPLPPPASWAGLSRSAVDFRRVAFRADFAAAAPGARASEARLYTGRSAVREDVKEPGYFVFAPARLADGAVVVVNRGFVGDLHPNAATRPAATSPGAVDIVGIMRWPDEAGWFDSAYSAADDLWFVRDQQKMAAQDHWGAVAPFYIEMEQPLPPGGVPRPGRLTVSLPNSHLQYAMTWYGLALVLLVVFAVRVRSRLRERAAAPL